MKTPETDDGPRAPVAAGREVRQTTPPNPRRRAVVASVMLVVCSSAMLLPVLGQALQDHLQIDSARFGLLFSVGPLTGTLALLPAGLAIHRWGATRVMRAAMAGLGLALLLVGLGSNCWWLLALALGVNGVFFGPLVLAVSTHLVQLFPADRRRVLAWNLAVLGAGGILRPLVAEGILRLVRALPALDLGAALRLTFFSVSAIAGGGSLTVRRPALPEAPASGTAWGAWKRVLRSSALVLVVLLALHGAADTTLYIWLPRFLGGGAFDSRPLAPGLVLVGFSGAYVVSRLLLTALPERFGKRVFLMAPGILGGTLFICGLLSGRYLLVALGYVLGSFCWSAEYPTMLGCLAAERHQLPAAMALSRLLSGALIALSVSGLGQLVRLTGDNGMWRVMILPGAVFILIGISGGLWVRRRQRSRRPEQTGGPSSSTAASLSTKTIGT